jgi:phosphoribosyl-ATP pyrophosphohydrolase/phosphoribosyl-AMP cyclohydrolase
LIDNETISKLNFDEKGLIPAVVQDIKTGKTLILAYMNREALDVTLREGKACFYSRSRKALWRKGETSGNTQTVCAIKADCEYNSLLVQVVPDGPACHTGEMSCFFNGVYDGGPAGCSDGGDSDSRASDGGCGANDNSADSDGAATGATGATTTAASDGASGANFSLDMLYNLIVKRKAERPEGSYTTYLFDKGLEKILKKVGEECSEVIIASMKRDKGETVYEAADLCYHMLVLLCEAGIEPSAVVDELRRRHKPETP